MPSPVIIFDYDTSWPAQFERERGRIAAALGEGTAGIEHVGSTAVPGLSAKPIIDILIGVRDLEVADECILPLVKLGYAYFPGPEDTMPERRYLDRRDEGDSFHLHMVAQGGEFWQRHLAFRDYLRAHPETATEYDRLKRDLAERFRDDREGYTNAKGDFIRAIEAKAKGLKA